MAQAKLVGQETSGEMFGVEAGEMLPQKGSLALLATAGKLVWLSISPWFGAGAGLVESLVGSSRRLGRVCAPSDVFILWMRRSGRNSREGSDKCGDQDSYRDLSLT